MGGTLFLAVAAVIWFVLLRRYGGQRAQVSSTRSAPPEL
jgi:hypothetical protein